MRIALLSALAPIVVLLTIGLMGCTPPLPEISEREADSLMPMMGSPIAEVEMLLPMKGEVSEVVDGDTFDMQLEDGTVIRIQLIAIDAPEEDQPFAEEAKTALQQILSLGPLVVDPLGKSTSGNTNGEAYAAGERVTLEMLQAGMAWHNKERSSDAELQEAENEAHAEEIGLWQDPNAMPPWDWSMLNDKERAELAEQAKSAG